jgi:hypothetical protein
MITDDAEGVDMSKLFGAPFWVGFIFLAVVYAAWMWLTK